MQDKALVLLSAGLDSSFNLFKAHFDKKVVLALTFDYGQRAAVRERECASYLAKSLNIPHQVIELPWFEELAASSLIDRKKEVPTKSVNINSEAQSLVTAESVWVPNRNGIFLNIAAGFAESLGAGTVIAGFNKEEAATFPDNSPEFMQALDKSFYYSTANHVQSFSYSTHLTKTEIVKEAKTLALPFERLWPCYFGESHWCGECESCQRFYRALAEGGVEI